MTIQCNEGFGEVNASNNIVWKLNGKLHRLDGPALIYENGKAPKAN